MKITKKNLEKLILEEIKQVLEEKEGPYPHATVVINWMSGHLFDIKDTVRKNKIALRTIIDMIKRQDGYKKPMDLLGIEDGL